MLKSRKHFHFLKSLKQRLRVVLVFSSVLPILFMGTVTGQKVYSIYETYINSLIHDEILQIKSSLDIKMESMKYMSQQLVYDGGTIGKDLYTYFDESDVLKKVNMLKYLNDQIATYELSNPNVTNITYLYKDNNGKFRKINNSLIREELPQENYKLTQNNQFAYYGPHDTLSVASHYLVISLVRKIQVQGYQDVYIYIESGYKKMNDFTAKTLDKLGAVYTIIGDDGNVIYSSKQIMLNNFYTWQDNKLVKIEDVEYRKYDINSGGWDFLVLVPENAYYEYMNDMIVRFVISVIFSIFVSLFLSYFLWNSIYRPLKQFERNLKSIVADDIQAQIETINVKELDENFAYFSKMKNRILSLLQTVKKEEREKSQLEVKQTIQKINPHFIHNTLDTLKWYVHEKGYEDVESFISSMNKLLVYNMEKDKVTTLKSELQAIRDYISLQSLKYNLNFNIHCDLPDALLETEMPRFILQPIVENAILHGTEGSGEIRIDVSLLTNGNISIKVINNGNPIDIAQVERVLNSAKDNSSNGIGLQYVIKMLDNTFDDQYGFFVTTSDNGENQVEITIPFMKGDYYVKNLDS